MRIRPSPFMRLAAAMVAGLGLLTSAVQAQGIETRAREAIVVDATSGTTLMEVNADARMPTASMSKIMTIFMVFEALEQGRLHLDDLLTVSERAWRMEGSRMFVEVGSQVPVEALIRGVIVQSGNDASVVLAEALGGTEEEFARMMTARAQELGLSGSQFMNATGLPDPQHYSTARDLVTLAGMLIERFPQYYSYYSELEFTWNDITQGNRNPLLYANVNADGLKTGYTSEAGYGLAGSALRGDRRIILVINGLESAQARSEEAVRLVDWAFREFEFYALFDAGEMVAEADVWMGEAASVPMVIEEDLVVSLRRAAWPEVSISVRTQEPLAAPVEAGQPIGALVVAGPGMPEQSYPLVAAHSVDRQGFFGRVGSGLGHLVSGIAP